MVVLRRPGEEEEDGFNVVDEAFSRLMMTMMVMMKEKEEGEGAAVWGVLREEVVESGVTRTRQPSPVPQLTTMKTTMKMTMETMMKMGRLQRHRQRPRRQWQEVVEEEEEEEKEATKAYCTGRGWRGSGARDSSFPRR